MEKLLAAHPDVNVIIKTRQASWSSWPYVLLPLGLLAALIALAVIIVWLLRSRPKQSHTERDEPEERLEELRQRKDVPDRTSSGR